MTQRTLAIGILIGGQGSRLGGVAKGLLPGPNGVPIIEQTLAQINIVAPHANIYLLGWRVEYEHLRLTHLADSPPNIGPLGGLCALLATGHVEVVLLGCDMPFVTAALLRRLLSVPCSTAVAAKGDSAYFQPLFSRFNVDATLPVVKHLLEQQRYSLQGVLTQVGAEVLDMNVEEAAQLRDWDTPEDIAAG